MCLTLFKSSLRNCQDRFLRAMPKLIKFNEILTHLIAKKSEKQTNKPFVLEIKLHLKTMKREVI